MNDIFFQIALTIFSIIIGVIATLVEKKFLKVLLILFTIVLCFTIIVWVGYDVLLDPSLQAEATSSPTISNPEAAQRKFQSVFLVGYSDLYQIEEYNLGLENGQNNLLGIPFETGWKVTTQCESSPNNVAEIAITDDISFPINIYFLLQAGWGLKEYEGDTIGNITLTFKNGNNFTTPLVMGENIRDWADAPDAVTTLSSPYARIAHKGIDPGSGKPGHIDMLAIPLPQEYSFEVLDTILIQDIANPNPCIHLLGITAETQ